MFVPISIDDFMKRHKKINPKENAAELRNTLLFSVEAKKNGAVCRICGQPIWAIGSASVGWDGCFSCITGDAGASEDYEIDSVCF